MQEDQIALMIGGVVTIATAITAMTPSRSDNKALNSILVVLNLLAGNVGKNKNADEESNPS
jgi:hypothetical protein